MLKKTADLAEVGTPNSQGLLSQNAIDELNGAWFQFLPFFCPKNDQGLPTYTLILFYSVQKNRSQDAIDELNGAWFWSQERAPQSRSYNGHIWPSSGWLAYSHSFYSVF